MAESIALQGRRRSGLELGSGRRHTVALNLFMVIVVAHWAEHLAQAAQIWWFGWSRPESGGVLGLAFPWLVKSEWMHYGYALVMLAGLWLLRTGFEGRARAWWGLAFAVQAFHHLEHLLLLLQALLGTTFFGAAVPTSLLQLVFPRVELHLFYNAVVTLPMLVAVVLYHRRRRAG